jgi:hypothetical protein
VSSRGCEPELVDENEVVAEQRVDDASDGVVGKSSVEGLDEFGSGEVPDTVSGLDGGDPERDKHVALARAGWSDEADILRGPDPFQAGEVVEGRLRDRGCGDVEVLKSLGDWERGLPKPGAGVGGVAGADLGLDQGAEELLGLPPLGFRGDQQLGCELPHRGHLQPLQPLNEVRRQWWRRRRGHDTSPPSMR